MTVDLRLRESRVIKELRTLSLLTVCLLIWHWAVTLFRSLMKRKMNTVKRSLYSFVKGLQICNMILKWRIGDNGRITSYSVQKPGGIEL